MTKKKNICAGLFLSLRGTPIDNDSFVDVDDIGEGDTALFCLTNATNCCTSTLTGGPALGNWFFPDGLGVPSGTGVSSNGFYRTRGLSVVSLHHQNNPSESLRGRFSCELLGNTIYVNICEWPNLIISYACNEQFRNSLY